MVSNPLNRFDCRMPLSAGEKLGLQKTLVAEPEKNSEPPFTVIQNWAALLKL